MSHSPSEGTTEQAEQNLDPEVAQLLAAIDENTTKLDPKLLSAIKNAPEYGMMSGNNHAMMWPLHSSTDTLVQRFTGCFDIRTKIIRILLNKRGKYLFFQPGSGDFLDKA